MSLCYGVSRRASGAARRAPTIKVYRAAQGSVSNV